MVEPTSRPLPLQQGTRGDGAYRARDESPMVTPVFSEALRVIDSICPSLSPRNARNPSLTDR